MQKSRENSPGHQMGCFEQVRLDVLLRCLPTWIAPWSNRGTGKITRVFTSNVKLHTLIHVYLIFNKYFRYNVMVKEKLTGLNSSFVPSRQSPRQLRIAQMNRTHTLNSLWHKNDHSQKHLILLCPQFTWIRKTLRPPLENIMSSIKVVIVNYDYLASTRLD